MGVAVTTATARASPAGSRVCFTRARYERPPGLGVTRRCTYQVESSALAGWHEGVIWPACRRARQRRQPVWGRPCFSEGPGPRHFGAAVDSLVHAAAGQDVLLATELHVLGPRPGFVPRPRLAGWRAGARAGPGLRPGWVRQDCPAGRLGPARRAAGGLAVAGRCRQRSGAVLAPRGSGGGPGMPRDWRAARSSAGPARTVLVRWAGDGADQRTGRRPGRCG